MESIKKKELRSIITAISLWTVIWKFYEISNFGNLQTNSLIRIGMNHDVLYFRKSLLNVFMNTFRHFIKIKGNNDSLESVWLTLIFNVSLNRFF